MTDAPQTDEFIGGDPLLSPEEDALLDKIWDDIDFSDTEVDSEPVPEDRSIRTDDPGATPEEYTAYWRDFDGLQADVREAWLDLYMSRAWEALQSIPPDNSEDAVRGVLTSLHDDLTHAWIGTLEAPGPLLAIALAGMASGNRALETGATAKPTRAEVGLAVSWSVLSEEALRFAQNYTFNLIRQIDDTTVKHVRDIISAGIEQGQSRDAVAEALGAVFTDKNRARLIAQTESIRAFNEGAMARWTNAGVVQGKWKTVRSAEVCPICRRLEGQVADIRTGWTDPATGVTHRALAHPGCRCFRQAVL